MRDLEIKIVQGVAVLLQSHAERLAKCDMTFKCPLIVVWQTKPNRYTSELRVTFYKKGEIDDVLEFHIYIDGRPLVTEKEAINWIEEQLLEIVNGASERGQSDN